MSTLEDKILGDKLHNYCSSSEDENDEEQNENESRGKLNIAQDNDQYQSKPLEWEGYSVNTGPKGVIKDWQRFKQIESEQRVERERERLKLIEKLSLNCNPNLDETSKNDKIDNEFDELLNDSDQYLKEFIKKRMEEMITRKQCEIKFGTFELLSSANDFLNAIEKVEKHITVICHIFNSSLPICKTMNGCLKCLAEQYPNTKFVGIEASTAGMSQHFVKNGVPALLAYKSGHLIGNFVSLTNEFGEDYFATDVEQFLIDHGILPDSTLIPEIIKSEQTS